MSIVHTIGAFKRELPPSHDARIGQTIVAICTRSNGDVSVCIDNGKPIVCVPDRASRILELRDRIVAIAKAAP